MSDDDFAHASAIAGQAEHEVAIYLRAAHECLGFCDPLRSGQVWIDTLESLEWPTRDYEKFFRRVTVLAVLQLFRRQKALGSTIYRKQRSSYVEIEGESGIRYWCIARYWRGNREASV